MERNERPMKKRLYALLIALLLLACHGEMNSPPTVVPEECVPTVFGITPDSGQEAEPTPLYSNPTPKQPPELQIQTWITDGQRYGCDLICWFDGFGLCYCVDDVDIETCEIRLSDRVSIVDIYSDNEIHDLWITNQLDCDSGYCIYLTSDTISYRIGFLRILNKMNLYGYGVCFELLTVGDPQAELLPEEPQFEYIWSDDGAYFSEVKKDGSILMHPTKFKESDVGFSEIDEARGEPMPITVTDETLTMICFFDSQRPDMLVSKERMLQLVRDGYFMDYPCWVQVSDGKLLAAMQLNDR